ncbi:MAG: 30S ribosomal protein S28e [Parcubacteria group bacterium]|nr:30S ribosomal protein S28e [Parcubacteria group bacterium]|tara:strand:- start:1180 stop:1470 length:291 start_codon:yes stop_codon:yes gene_type:complete
MAKTFQKGKKPEDSKAEGEIRFPIGVPAEVKEIITRQGTKGDITQVLCKILDGRDKNKTLRRNVRGPVKLRDILVLLETEMEAQRLGGGRKGGRRK